jgi:hypothetical protein
MSAKWFPLWALAIGLALDTSPLQAQSTPLTDAIRVSAGDEHTCALMMQGRVMCWGSNTWGQLGDGTATDRLTPTPVVGLAGEAVAIDAGYHHTCALLASGVAQCWGRNVFGQLGDGTTADRLTPTTVVGLSGLGTATAVSAGADHTCVLATSGATQCWGHRNWGALGNGSSGATPNPEPVVVSGLGMASTGSWGLAPLLVVPPRFPSLDWEVGSQRYLWMDSAHARVRRQEQRFVGARTTLARSVMEALLIASSLRPYRVSQVT